MDEKYYIRLILSKNSEIHSRCNEAVEEILRRGESEQSIRKLIESIRYKLDEMENILNNL